MKKSIILSILSVLSIILVPTVKADSPINGQFMTSIQPIYPTETIDKNGNVINNVVTSFDPVSNVPQGSYVAHVMTNTETIDVQRFIDPSTSVSCYYSEIQGKVFSVNCVPVSPSSK